MRSLNLPQPYSPSLLSSSPTPKKPDPTACGYCFYFSPTSTCGNLFKPTAGNTGSPIPSPLPLLSTPHFSPSSSRAVKPWLSSSSIEETTEKTTENIYVLTSSPPLSPSSPYPPGAGLSSPAGKRFKATPPGCALLVAFSPHSAPGSIA